MLTESQIQTARSNWKIASNELEFEFISPFFIFINGQERSVFGYLPEFGSSNGTLVEFIHEPEFEIDIEIVKWARGSNVHSSFINVVCCLEYNRDYFRDILGDWGKYK